MRVGKIYPFGPFSPASKTRFDAKNFGVIAIKTKGGIEMPDLYKEFMDWLEYNYPGTKLEPLQDDLAKVALRHWNIKVTKAARKAVLKALAEAIIVGK